jgi:hypothetical protein
MNSASLCSLAGRYDNPIPPLFLAHRLFKIPALYSLLPRQGIKDEPYFTLFLYQYTLAAEPVSLTPMVTGQACMAKYFTFLCNLAPVVIKVFTYSCKNDKNASVRVLLCCGDILYSYIIFLSKNSN